MSFNFLHYVNALTLQKNCEERFEINVSSKNFCSGLIINSETIIQQDISFASRAFGDSNSITCSCFRKLDLHVNATKHSFLYFQKCY